MGHVQHPARNPEGLDNDRIGAVHALLLMRKVRCHASQSTRMAAAGIPSPLFAHDHTLEPMLASPQNFIALRTSSRPDRHELVRSELFPRISCYISVDFVGKELADFPAFRDLPHLLSTSGLKILR